MSRLNLLLPAALALAGLALPAMSAAPPASEKAKPAPKARPKVEGVVCLDTTGSMTKLIDGAKAKVWSICNQIAGGKPVPDLKVGLVAYRDKKDEYVTRVHDLTDDLDAVHGQLKTFKADGGGDVPEHVNQALFDAVNKVKWSDDKRTLRIIFLVGDAPPHMDYTDDVKYPETCKKAVEKGIIINAIQCGDDAECARYWKDIAAKSEGSFVSIAQDGGVAKAVATPHDKRLAEINRELAGSTLVYGSARAKRDGKDKAEKAKELEDDAAADRAAFAGKSGRGPGYDLVEALKSKKVDLKKMKDEELPEELRKLKTVKEREEYIKKLERRRAELNKEAVELDKKRADYIAKNTREKGKDGFDASVLRMLRKQAKKTGIEY